MIDYSAGAHEFVTPQRDQGETAAASPAPVLFPTDDAAENALVYGPAMSGKDRLAFEAVAESLAPGQTPVLVTTSDTAEQCRDRFAEVTPGRRANRDVVVIEANDATQSEGPTDGWTLAVPSPADLTGVGIALTKSFERLDQIGTESPFVVVDNLTTLLIYTDLDRVFRFVDTLNARVDESGRCVLYLLDDDAVDERTQKRLLQLFSRAVETRTLAERTQFRHRGTSDSDWHDYDLFGDAR